MLSASLFEPASSSPWVRGFVLAAVNQIVYEDDRFVRAERAAGLELEEVQFFSRRSQWAVLTDTQASILMGERLLVITFRGSETDFSDAGDVVDWFNDLEVTQRPYRGTKVHGGFARAADAIWPDIVASIKRWGGGRQVWLTGHSLGGAVAQLMGYNFHRVSTPVAGVVTFGSPRVGGVLWRRHIRRISLEKKNERWVNNDDPVARAPFPVQPQIPLPIPTSPLWSHVGALHFIDWDAKRAFLFEDSPGKILVPRVGFDDHSIAGYKNRIWDLMPAEEKDQIVTTFDHPVRFSELTERVAEDRGGKIVSPPSLRGLYQQAGELASLKPRLSFRKLSIRHR